MKARLTVITLAIVLMAASAVWGRSDDEKRYQFYMGQASGLLDLHIDQNDDECQGGLILFKDENGKDTEFETDFGKCQVLKRTTDDKGAWTQIWIQFTKKKDDDRVFYGWVSIEGYKISVSGYWEERGAGGEVVGPFFAIQNEVNRDS